MIVPDREARERAITDHATTLVVEAGAGTGKTTLLVERTLALLRAGVPLSRLVLITFTRKAAAEMSGRIRRRLTEEREEEWAHRALQDFAGAHIGTTDSFCRSLLSDFPLEAGVPPGFQVADGIAQEALREEAWIRHLDRCAREGDDTFVLLREAGVKTGRLRRLANGVIANRDLELHAIAAPDPPDLVAGVEERLREVHAASELCTDTEDRLLQIIRALEREWREARAVAGTAAERLLLSWKTRERKIAPRNAGKAAAWGGSRNKQRALETLTALDATLGEALHARGRCLAARTSRWLAGFRDEYQRLKRERGLLDFQDLALATRNLLRDNEPVRQRLAARFEAILMDEVQDTDPLQMEIAFLLAARGPVTGDPLTADVVPGRLFLVGDPKQSIYRFRRADIELYDCARDRLTRAGSVLDIRANFRAEAQLLEVTNQIFRNWMKPTSQIPFQAQYTDLLATRDPGSDAERRLSLLLPDPAVESDLLARTGREKSNAAGRREAEIDAVARAVRHVLGLSAAGTPWSVRDPESGSVRPARPADVAVLVRRIAWGDHLAEALRRRRIPVSVGGGKRFYAREEIATLHTILRALTQPGSDFAAFAALRSPVFGLPDDSLVLHYLGKPCPPDSPAPNEILARFSEWRRCARVQTLPDFLEYLAAEVSLHAVFGFRPDGPGRIEALRMLLEAADSLEEAGLDTLPAFVRWLGEQNAEARADDLGESEPGARGGVQILSIHKAKGLEFPIVIVADLGSGTPRDRLLVTDRGGRRLEFRLSAPRNIETEGFAGAAEVEASRERAEEVRLLYVALTRARDSLLLSWPHAKGGVLAEESLCAAVGCSPGQEPPAESNLGVLRAAELPSLEDSATLFPINVEKACRIAERHRAAETPEPWPAARDRASRGTRVLPATAIPGPRPSQAVPAPPRAGPTGAAYGTLIHKALELYEPGPSENARAAVDRAAPLASRALSRESGDAVSFDEETLRHARATLDRVVWDIALAPLWSAARLHREVPFLLPRGEDFISGTVDAVVESGDGRLTLYDYKTGRWTPAEEESARATHRTQALVYALAVAEITGLSVDAVRFLFLSPTPVAELAFPVDEAFLDEARSIVAVAS